MGFKGIEGFRGEGVGFRIWDLGFGAFNLDPKP